MTIMKSLVQSTKDIPRIIPQLNSLGKSRWNSFWDDNHGDIDRGYPHKFGNTENLSFEDCMEGTLVEYPLKTKTPWKGGSRPGADRVVYLLGEDKTFCGASNFYPSRRN
jgi:hypothetical protein